ncbi:MAG: queuosine precursor transporter [Spirochaetales bacterium]
MTFTNEFLWLAMLLVNFAIILLMYRFAGRMGLFIWIPIATITANLQVLKTVEIFGLTATLGNIVYATTFLVTDILGENYGRKDAGRAVAVGFLSLISVVVLMQLALLFEPSVEDFAQPHLSAIFQILPRVTLASVAAYALSQYHDVWAYQFWKKRFPQPRRIWIRNNLSTLVSQLIDSAIFSFAAFLGVFELSIVIEIAATTYLFKVIVAVADTPLVYLAQRWKARRRVNEPYQENA